MALSVLALVAQRGAPRPAALRRLGASAQRQLPPRLRAVAACRPASFRASPIALAMPAGPGRPTNAAAAAAAASGAEPLPGSPAVERVEDAPTFEVGDIAGTEAVVKKLLALPADTVFACDTEVAELNIKKSPLGQGKVICVSVYAGPDADLGPGPGHCLWVETVDPAVLEALRPFLEAERCAKVWHNYGFDRHVLWNHGIDVKGFGGDTMHMARLWDASRKAGYSLEVLTDELVGRRKTPMKELFGVAVRKKDGTPGKVLKLPPVDELQNNPMTRPEWIAYSCYDSQGTWLLHERLRGFLREMEWQDGASLYEYYMRYWNPFGEILTDLEREGIRVETEHMLPAAERRALAERQRMDGIFRRWAASYVPEAWFMNPGSGPQVQTLLFGGAMNAKTKTYAPKERVFNLPREEYEELLAARDSTDESALPFEAALLTTERRAGDNLRTILIKAAEAADRAKPDTIVALGTARVALAKDEQRREAERGLQKPGTAKVDFTIESMCLKVRAHTKSGSPATDAATLRDLAGRPRDDPPVYGVAYEDFGGGAMGVAACEALDALVSMGAIDTMLSNFILPLQENADAGSRIHCSLNLNTETGRLSSRAPNLQNQPALEKDQYRIREAFCAEEGNALVVADYGQLELRLLAHMTDCQSMLTAFRSGGCFHSRTAMGMFDHVKAAVDEGSCLLEWDYSKGEPPAPLLKDVFGSERRRAKTLNFSIAYGKTVHGLSKDWGVSRAEAGAMLEAWYADRPEVQAWQKHTIAEAHRTGATRTLMGRYRKLNGINSDNQGVRGHLERAAINTPIQGGAADIMTLCMIKLKQSTVLKHLGYRMLLQIHDEVILEGPKEHALAAKAEVVACMEQPFDEALPSLKVDLAVDAKTASNWFEAK